MRSGSVSVIFKILVFTRVKTLIALLFISALLSAQVKIKERVEIKPTGANRPPSTINTSPPSVTLTPLDPAYFALGESGGFLESYDDHYDDNIFVPRIGGTIGLSLNQCNGSASGYTEGDILLVFGPDGNIRNQIPLTDLHVCRTEPAGSQVCFWNPMGSYQTCYISDGSPICFWNPWEFSEELFIQTEDSSLSYYPPIRMFIPVNAWEPLRFRLYTFDERVIPCNFNTSYGIYAYVFTNYPGSYDWDWACDIGSPPYSYSGLLVCRSRDVDTVMNYDYATVFPLKWMDIDSTAVGGSPIVTSPAPIIIPDSGMYRIFISAAKPHVNGVLSLTAPTSEVLFSDVQSSIGDTILVGPFSEGTTLQVVFNGRGAGASQGKYGVWDMGFESWIDYDFADVLVTVEYAVQPPDHIELWAASSVVYYGDTVDIDVVPVGSDSLFSPLGPDQDYEFYIELTGDTPLYGELIFDGQSGDYVEDIPSIGRRGVGAKFAANGLEPENPVDLSFYIAAIYVGEEIPTAIGEPPIRESEQLSNRKQSAGKSGVVLLDNKSVNVAPRIISQNSRLEKSDIRQPQGILKIDETKKKKVGIKSASNKRKRDIRESVSKKTISPSAMQGIAEYTYMDNDWYIQQARPKEILLGETIYFKAKINPKYPTNLIIDTAAIEDGTGKPFSGGAVDVDFFIVREFGDKIGVYWEQKWPKWTGNLLEMQDLDPGLIRIVGRYWQEGLKYQVRLWARLKSNHDVAGNIPLEVMKPAKLGDTYTYSRDVHDSPIGDPQLNIDEKCIEYGGEYGIPPQFIKAQIFNEASKNLDGIEGKGFAPTYVYEPYTAQFLDWTGHQFKKGMWLVDKKRPQAQWMGTGKPVPDHQNVQDFPYPTEPQTVWDMIVEHSQLVNATPGFAHTKYGLRKANGEMNFYPNAYVDIDKMYKKLLKTAYYSTYFYPVVGKTYADISREYMIRYLKYEWQNVGAENVTAQTRVASSYGFLQLTFYRAVEKRSAEYPCYDPDKSPEDLNETDIDFQYGLVYQKKILIRRLGMEHEASGNWQNGLEGTFKKYVWEEWNDDPNYPSKVAKEIYRFIPK